MLHRVATKVNTELIAQQMISAMKTPPVCESSTLVKKKHFVVLLVSIPCSRWLPLRNLTETTVPKISPRCLLSEHFCENADIKFQMS